MVVLVELGVTNPVPALNAPALSHEAQQRIWGGAQAGDKAVRSLERLAITGACRDHFRDPAGAMPIGLNVLRRFFRPQSPEDVTAMADFVITCDERDLALSNQLAGDLAVESLLVGFDRQQEVGPLLLELPKNACCVWSASAWMSTPSRSSSPSNLWSTARSWFSLVA